MDKIKEVFFDCDGTLIDSEIIAMGVAGEVLIDEMRKNDPEIDNKIQNIIGDDYKDGVDFIVQNYAGWHFDKMIEAVSKEFGVPINAQTADDKKIPATLEGLKKVPVIDGIWDALQQKIPAKGLDFSLVTSSEFQRVNLCLEVTGLDNYFPEDRKFSAHDSLSPPDHKPSPAVYLLALKERGLEADEVVSVEDSKSGVESSVRAGIACIGFVGATHIPHKEAAATVLLEKGAAFVITDMNDLDIALEMIEGDYSNTAKMNGQLFMHDKAAQNPAISARKAPQKQRPS